MHIDIIPSIQDDETAFRNLYQFYMYEFARFMGWDVTYGGRYFEDDLDGCWTEDYRHPFLIKVNGKLGGFAIVEALAKSFYNDETDIIYMAEFFIMGPHQGKGIGEKAAVYLFDLFPGKWQVSELAQNVNAQAFWRKIIARYTNGQYQEIIHGERKTVVQMFESRTQKAE